MTGLAVLLATLLLVEPALARSRKKSRVPRKKVAKSARVYAPVIPARLPAPLTPPAGPYASALLIDAESGRVLFESAADVIRQPASLVKMMLALVTFEAIEAGETSLDRPFRVSALASRTGGSGVALRVGEVLTLEDLLKAVLIASANGASVAIAEGLEGSTERMVARMNLRARQIGMTQTVFQTVNGLPPRRKGAVPDVTTAADLAILARKLLEHERVLDYVSQPLAPFRNGTVLMRNTNHLVGRMDGADGLKTGYYRVAGFNLASTARRDGLRLVAVVLGCPTLRSRFQVSQQLLEWGFANYSKVPDRVEPYDQPAALPPAAEGIQPVAAPQAGPSASLGAPASASALSLAIQPAAGALAHP